MDAESDQLIGGDISAEESIHGLDELGADAVNAEGHKLIGGDPALSVNTRAARQWWRRCKSPNVTWRTRFAGGCGV